VNKKLLLLSALVCAPHYAAYASDVLVEEPLNRFCVATYNGLPSVEAANAGLLSLGKTDDFLTEVSDLIAGYDSVNFLGVRLIHQHNTLADGEIMLEEFKYDEGEPVFITSNKSIETKGSIPASWLITPSGLRAFEYSTDVSSLAGFQYLNEHPETLRIVTSTLQKYGLESYLAPAVLMLDAFRYFEPSDRLLETSRIVARGGHEIHENVVKGVPSDAFSALDVIKTSWGINQEAKELMCVSIRFCWTKEGGIHGGVDFRHQCK
jgi:hypothetical protein